MERLPTDILHFIFELAGNDSVVDKSMLQVRVGLSGDIALSRVYRIAQVFGDFIYTYITSLVYDTCLITNISNMINLKKVRFDYMFNTVIPVDFFPDSVRYVKFGLTYNQPILPGALNQVKRVKFGVGFNQPISKGVLPPGTEEVNFDFYYDQPLTTIMFPPSTKIVTVCDYIPKLQLPGIKCIDYYDDICDTD